MNLIIDVGNTRIKAAVFEKDTLVDVLIFEEAFFLEKIRYLLRKHPVKDGVVSSVGNLSLENLSFLKAQISVLVLDATVKIPFKNLYKTPHTLGVDRIALVTAAAQKFKNNNVLIIDVGTCITYDFLTSENEYLGGAISPGIRMRYLALSTFTSKLPMLEKPQISELTGDTTDTSMHSGVVNGVLLEIEGVIAEYKNKNRLLTVVLTGGDTNFLAKQLKSSIFATSNFILEGLNAILIYNRGGC